MREDLLHFIWKTNKISSQKLLTTKGDSIVIHHTGQHNHGSGPDFFNAKLEIDGQIWAGNVEMHVRGSDWYAHGHELDKKYDNVILHVVWQDDVSVFRMDNSEIPTLELNGFISNSFLQSYQNLFKNSKRKFINCENDIADVNSFLAEDWLHRLYFERLEEKSRVIHRFLHDSKNDWEKVLFILLLKSFGLNINKNSYESLAKAIDFSVVRKLQNNTKALESVLFGMTGLLDEDQHIDGYHSQLQSEFKYQANKFGLNSGQVQKPEFFGLRPHNFPTIRLSQLANLYTLRHNLFSELIAAGNVTKIRSILKVTPSPYWKNHFNFGKESKPSGKMMSNGFMDLLIINTVIPLKFCYAKKHGREIHDELVGLISVLKPEKNTIISNFDRIGFNTENALQSQSKIQLYKEYCVKNQCLKCRIGTSVLNGNS